MLDLLKSGSIKGAGIPAVVVDVVYFVHSSGSSTGLAGALLNTIDPRDMGRGVGTLLQSDNVLVGNGLGGASLRGWCAKGGQNSSRKEGEALEASHTGRYRED